MVQADMLSRIVEEEQLRQSSQAVVVVASLEEGEVHSVWPEDKKLDDTLEGSHSQGLEEVVVRSMQDMLVGHSEQNLSCSSASCWVEDRKDNQSKQMVEVVHIQHGCSSLDRTGKELVDMLGAERQEDSHTQEAGEDNRPWV